MSSMEEFQMRNKIIILNKGDKSLDLLNNLKSISLNDIKQIGDEIDKNKEECLLGNDLLVLVNNEKQLQLKKLKLGKNVSLLDNSNIISFFKENCLSIEDNFEYQGFRGRKVTLSLPPIGCFLGYKLSFFDSEGLLSQQDINKSKINDKLFSKNEFSSSVYVFNRFLHLIGIDADKINFNTSEDIDNYIKHFYYLNQLSYGMKSKAFEFLKQIIDFKSNYWLKDTDKVVDFGEIVTSRDLLKTDEGAFYSSTHGSAYNILLKFE